MVILNHQVAIHVRSSKVASFFVCLITNHDPAVCFHPHPVLSLCSRPTCPSSLRCFFPRESWIIAALVISSVSDYPKGQTRLSSEPQRWTWMHVHWRSLSSCPVQKVPMESLGSAGSERPTGNQLIEKHIGQRQSLVIQVTGKENRCSSW